jgi:hypothetical protein
VSTFPPIGFRLLLAAFFCLTGSLSTFAQEGDNGAAKRQLMEEVFAVDSIVSPTSLPAEVSISFPEGTIVTKEKKIPKERSKEITPKRVALLGLACPGLGQIYNQKYWKLPIVYGLIGTGAFFTGFNAKELRVFNRALEQRFNGEPDPFLGIYTTDEMYAFRKVYQRNVEVSGILTGLAWGLQIVDAVVDAHLKRFDISDDLSLQLRPTISTHNGMAAPGIGIFLRWQ